jgi:hypothetical protein
MKKSAILCGSALFLCAMFVLAPGAVAQYKQEVRDFPPDFNHYARPLVSADLAPGGEAGLAEGAATAVAPALFPAVVVKDVIVSNTNANLKNTNTASNSEPSIAINPVKPLVIDILAFTANWGVNAPIWHSTNGGNTWTLDLTVPNPPGIPATGICPCDQAPDYGTNGLLSATFLDLNSGGGPEVFTASTTAAPVIANWHWPVVAGVTQTTNLFGHNNADQPWLLVNIDPVKKTQRNVYVAYDDFHGAPDMRVSVAPGGNPPVFGTDKVSGFSQGAINPGHRLATDPVSGAVYSLFQQCPTTVANCLSISADPKTIRYMLNRSTDGGKTWKLNGLATGIVVATAQSTQPRPKFGTVNALLGGVDHVAVDPNNGDVYVVYGARDSVTKNNRLVLARLVPNGTGGLKIASRKFVTGQLQAALPSVAVTKNSLGSIGVLYTVSLGLDAASGFPKFSARLAVSNDHGLTFKTVTLENFLSPATDNLNTRQRVLGDYQQIKAVANSFYGVFSGNGAPFGRPFSNIDPIFFTTSMAP